MSSSEILETNVAAGAGAAHFEDKSISDIAEWAENVSALMNPERLEGEVNPDVAVALSALHSALERYETASEGEKDEVESIVKEKAENLCVLLERGSGEEA
jgi:hypothetical protein